MSYNSHLWIEGNKDVTHLWNQRNIDVTYGTGGTWIQLVDSKISGAYNLLWNPTQPLESVKPR